MLNIKVPKIYRPIYEAPKRFNALKGGRGSGKSWAVADKILFSLIQNPNLDTVCLREIQKSIAKSSKKLLEDRIDFYQLYDYFEVLSTEIRCKKGDGVIIFKGLQDHTADSIKSLEGFDICWVEEAQTITEFSLNLLTPTIRKDESVFYFTWNPRYPNDPIEIFFTNKNKSLVIHSTYLDNPYCPNVLIDEAKEMKQKNYSSYEHTYLGHFVKDDDMAILQRKWLDACVDAHLKLKIDVVGRKQIGYDVADGGDDKNAIVCTHGILAYDCVVWEGGKDNLFPSSRKVLNHAYGTKADIIIYDNVGVGAGVGSNLNELKSDTPHFGFSAGAKVINPESDYKKGKKNKDAFKNLKAQAWFVLRDRIIATYNRVVNGIPCPDDEIISISGHIPLLDYLLTELSTPREEVDSVGRLKVESKKDLEKRGIKSPNMADAFVMSFFAPPTTKVKSFKVNI